MPAQSIDTLSSYIVSFANAAAKAQQALSRQDEPMTIKQYRFKVNITADFEAKPDGEVSVKVAHMDMKDKLFFDYKESMGIELECTIGPGIAPG
jgi:hypothetical protein